MIKKTIKCFSIILLVCTVIFVNHYAVCAENAQNWYCKREKEHLRPCIDPTMSYIEEENGFFIGKDPDEKVIYLTFDAGYENGNVARILDTLKKHDVEGAFFILENLINRNTDLVMRMKEEGHLVCNHTAKHKDMTKINEDEIKKEIQTLETLYAEKIGGELAPFFRPPEGKFDKKSLQIVNDLGYTTVFWSIAYADWDNNKQPSHDFAKKILSENLHNGAVILLHPTSKTNADILDQLITEWKAEGYRFGSLREFTEKCG